MNNKIFSEVGKQYGYERVKVEFVPYTQFKIQWSRSYKRIEFRVSDYLENAPENIMRDLATELFSKINGDNYGYSDDFKAYVLAPEFSQTHRKTFMERNRFIYTESENKNLADSVNRLVKAGLLPENHNIEVVWDHSYGCDLASTYSVLMRVILVNYQLDDKDVPDYTIDYAIYHDYLNIEAGSKVFDTDDEMDIREDLTKFEKCAEAEKELDKRCLAL